MDIVISVVHFVRQSTFKSSCNIRKSWANADEYKNSWATFLLLRLLRYPENLSRNFTVNKNSS